ncbi:MAG: tRNA lysidine(34) synthetase TilS, partial [Pricia sp.]|nr:tRNA lysidine(34) synthetase TilS [Pricia sp.]
MLEEFITHIENHFPNLLEERFLIACSGGIDSMVLVDLCARANLHFALAHCNFRLRGSESDGDEKLVRETAQKEDIRFYVTHFDTIGYMNEKKVSLQVATRELRYAWFAEIMHENGIDNLITGHHADDNLETFLINLSRGTGIDGLTGIPEKTETISRPLLRFSRNDILQYAKSENIQWREDSTNAETKYVRNNIRHRIVPLLKELNSNFLTNFQNTQDYLGQTAKIADNHIEQVRNTYFKNEGDRTRISVLGLSQLKPLKGYLYGLFKSYGFTEWDDVENLLTAMSGKEVFSETHRLIKDRDNLLLVKRNHTDENQYEIKENQHSIDVP